MTERCPQAEYDGHPCYRCKVKDSPEEWSKCPHEVVSERGPNWWKKIEMTELTEGHGQTDVSCIHGSRWMWWSNEEMCIEGQWTQVILAPDCDCGTPPKPNKEEKQ